LIRGCVGRHNTLIEVGRRKKKGGNNNRTDVEEPKERTLRGIESDPQVLRRGQERWEGDQKKKKGYKEKKKQRKKKPVSGQIGPEES